MSRKTAQDLSGKGHVTTSAREISDSYSLPFEITAKTLQRLRDTGIIQSEQGARGGYSLKKKLTDVSLAEFLELMEGPQSFVACAPTPAEMVALTPQIDRSVAPTPCEYKSKCEIQGIMGDLNSRIFKFMASICLAEITDTDSYFGLSTGQSLGALASAGTQLGSSIGDEP